MPTVTSENSLQFKLDKLAEQGIIKPVKLSESQSKEPNINDLKAEVDRGIAEHMSLQGPARVANTRRAIDAVADYVGRNKNGKVLDLLSQNQKLTKAEKGVEEGEAVTLPDGRGVVTKGLALSPAYEEGSFSTCPNSKSCKSSCLGKTSGGYFFAGGGADLDALTGPRMLAFKKTQAFLRNPAAFAVRMSDEITAAKMMAAMEGNHLGVRLNVLSDIHPKVWESLIKAHPDVTFYDYTKNATKPVAPNYHLTYSSTGISTNQVNNPHQNWKRMRTMLDSGSNVAMAFSHKSELPHEVYDEESGKTYKVISGDDHDFRPLDQVSEGDGYIIGLKNKAATTSEANASEKSGGFFVPYDPQIMKEKGKIVRDEMGNPIVQNRTVRIPKQAKPSKNVDNNGAVLA
jgi:hypothetical protein